MKENVVIRNKVVSTDTVMRILDALTSEKNKYESEMDSNKNSFIKYEITIKDNLPYICNSYDECKKVIYERLSMIEKIDCLLNITYSSINEKNEKIDNVSYIHFIATENLIEIIYSGYDLNSSLKDTYLFIKGMFNNCKDRYDWIVKNNFLIKYVVTNSYSYIYGTGLSILLMIFGTIRNFYSFIFGFLILDLLLSYVIGKFLFDNAISNLYNSILPGKKNIGFKKGGYEIVNDIDNYKEYSEVIIGKNSFNLKDREEILKLYSNRKDIFIKEIGIIIVLSIIIGLIL